MPARQRRPLSNIDEKWRFSTSGGRTAGWQGPPAVPGETEERYRKRRVRLAPCPSMTPRFPELIVSGPKEIGHGESVSLPRTIPVRVYATRRQKYGPRKKSAAAIPVQRRPRPVSRESKDIRRKPSVRRAEICASSKVLPEMSNQQPANVGHGQISTKIGVFAHEVWTIKKHGRARVPT